MACNINGHCLKLVQYTAAMRTQQAFASHRKGTHVWKCYIYSFEAQMAAGSIYNSDSVNNTAIADQRAMIVF